MNKIVRRIVFVLVAISPLGLTALAGGVIATLWSSSFVMAQGAKICKLQKDDQAKLNALCDGFNSDLVLFTEMLKGKEKKNSLITACPCPKVAGPVKGEIPKGKAAYNYQTYRLRFYEGSTCAEFCTSQSGGDMTAYYGCYLFCIQSGGPPN